MPDILDLHDSEIARLGDVVEKLHLLQGKTLNLEAFRRQAEQRFEEVGFRVSVKVWTTDQDGLYAFDIDIIERLEGTFDPDRQVHEVTNDLLGLGEGGVIKSGDLRAPQSHSHGGKKHHHH